MDNLLQFLNNSSAFQYYFTLIWLIVFPLIILVVLLNLFLIIKKYFPIKLKDVFNGEKIKPEKTIYTAGKLGWCNFGGRFFTMDFYTDFLIVSYLGRCIIAMYSEKTEIGKTFFGTNFVKFPDINPQIIFYFYSKKDAEYTKERFGNCAEKGSN